MRKVDFPLSFTPSTGVINASNIVGFDTRTVVAILDTTAADRPTIYDMATPGRGFASTSGSSMTLEYDTSGLSSSDTIVIFWDDGQSTGDALLAIAQLLSPTVIAQNLAALSGSQKFALINALAASCPDIAIGDAVPSVGQPFWNSSGFLVRSR